MDVRQLQVLAEVARTGSFTAAGQALGYTQPAVSYHMAKLQQAVGAPLVVRHVETLPRGQQSAADMACLTALRTSPPKTS